MDLINQISEFTNWKVSFMTIEVGARRCVGKSLWNCLGKLGFSHSASTKICKSVSLIAAKCSYAIYLASKSRSWDAQRPLIAYEDQHLFFVPFLLQLLRKPCHMYDFVSYVYVCVFGISGLVFVGMPCSTADNQGGYPTTEGQSFCRLFFLFVFYSIN